MLRVRVDLLDAARMGQRSTLLEVRIANVRTTYAEFERPGGQDAGTADYAIRAIDHEAGKTQTYAIYDHARWQGYEPLLAKAFKLIADDERDWETYEEPHA